MCWSRLMVNVNHRDSAEEKKTVNTVELVDMVRFKESASNPYISIVEPKLANTL